MPRPGEFVLTLSCRDAKGIVHAVSGALLGADCNILDSQQFGDVSSPRGTGLFFMRVHFEAPASLHAAGRLDTVFDDARQRFGLSMQVHALTRKPRLLLLVSRQGHCLNDLLFRWHSGQLDADVRGVVSNHPDFGELARAFGLAFHHFPVAAGAREADKRAQESRIEALIDAEQVDLVVLARYMQILSPALCRVLAGRAINIHHSFLPSFKGARPYEQAHDRGVKLIGATAHYVTAELDEGPIIEQDVARVDHAHETEDLAAVGRDVESVVLARAVRWHVEHRVLMNGNKTVVFR